MIFSNPDNDESYVVKIIEAKITPGGRLKLKAVDAERPKLKPGYITFSDKDLKKILKVLKERDI